MNSSEVSGVNMRKYRGFNNCFMIIISVLFILSYTMSINSLLWIIYLLIILKVSVSNFEESIYIILFLLPNIRIFDPTGHTFLINLLLLYIIMLYFFKKSFAFKVKHLLYLIILVSFDIFHIVFSQNITSIFANISWYSAFIIFIISLTDKNTSVLKNKSFYFLSRGVILSALVGYIANPYFLEYSGRLYGMAGDPNYFSVYILACIFSILPLLEDRKDKKNFFIFVVLVMLGMLTLSKMFLIIFVFLSLASCVYLLVFTHKTNFRQKKFLIYLVLFVSLLMVMNPSVVLTLTDNILVRFNLRNSSSFSLNSVTTGRSSILTYYLEQLAVSPLLFIVGYGKEYFNYFSTIAVHNTYLDIILSWGIIGFTSLVIIIYDIVKDFRKKNTFNSSMLSWYPLFSFLLSLLSLSAFNADMFFIVFSYVLIQRTDTKKSYKV